MDTVVPDQTGWLRICESERWVRILGGWLDLDGSPHRKGHPFGVGKQDK